MTLIMGRPSLPLDALSLAVAAQEPDPEFYRSVVPALWAAALRYGVDPLAMVAQSAHETGWGRFGRAASAWHRNTCGLKVRDLDAVLALLPPGATSEHPLCHAQFADWAAGAEAHAQHLRAYCQVPFADTVTDPRYRVVTSINASTRRPPAVRLADLDPWAGRAGYGASLEQVADRLLRAAGA